ncbi:MAG TPA: hypothetical protein VGF29_15385 [Hyphomicrobiaceae bacterium]
MATTTIPQNVLKMPGARRVSKPRPARPPRRRQTRAAAAVGAVAMVLTGLSLHHLASGIELVTKAPTPEAWAMAVGVDLGFIALEAAQLCAASAAAAKAIGRYSKPAIVGTLAASAVMNALAFAAQAEGLLVYPAAALGVAIPALIYCLSRVAFGLSVTR